MGHTINDVEIVIDVLDVLLCAVTNKARERNTVKQKSSGGGGAKQAHTVARRSIANDNTVKVSLRSHERKKERERREKEKKKERKN